MALSIIAALRRAHRLSVAALTLLPMAVAQANPSNLSAAWRINGNGFAGDVSVQQAPDGRLAGSIYGEPLSGFYAPGERAGVWLRGPVNQPSQAFVAAVSPDGMSVTGRFYGLNASTSGASAQRNVFGFAALRAASGPPPHPGLPAAGAGPASIGGTLPLTANNIPGQLVLQQAPDGQLTGTIYGDRLSGHYAPGSGTLAFLRFTGSEPVQLYVGNVTAQGISGDFYALTVPAGGSAQRLRYTWSATSPAAMAQQPAPLLWRGRALAGATQPTVTPSAVPVRPLVPKVLPPMPQMTSGAPSGGVARILAAGGLKTTGPAVSEGTLVSVTSAYPSPTGDLRIMTRREYRDRVDTELRKVEERILLTADQNVYPGALLQGRNFENGNFAPITIPRMPGTITVQGLTLRPGSSLTRTVASPTGGEVGNAIADILNQAVGTAARFKFEESAANTTSKLLFDLGVDVRYGSASVNSTLNVNTSQNRNFAFLAFRQILYSVNFEPPASPVSVFRDGDGFQDPLNQIGPGNPPLYVSSVSYGRIVLFRAESEQSSSEIKAALEAAFKGGADVKVSSKLTAKQTLDASTLSYMVLGGNAAEALQPIAAADKFQAVRQFISNASAAQVSPSNPGLPIAYSLKYLKDNTDAMMVYSTGPYTASDITFADLEQKWSTMRQCRWEFSDPQDGDANDILVSSEWNSPTVPDGQVQFNLVAGPGITWYKGLRLMNRDTGGTFSEPFTQDGRTTSSILVPASFVNRLRAELMKAKFLGRHELVGSIGDGFQYVPPKTRVTFEWRRDSRNAPEVASSQNPKACRF